MTTKPAAPLSIVTRNLDQLIQDPSNPRTHDTRNLHAIRASLEEHGQVEPILVQQSTGMVIAGNGRMTAMRAIGWETAEVALLDVSDEQARRLSIALNRSGELAGWNEETLAIHLHELSKFADAFDPTSLGFDVEEMDALVAAYVVMDQLNPGASTVFNPEMPSGPGVPPSSPGLPPASSPVPSTNSKVVQLFLDENTITEFQVAIRALAAVHGTDNITDTVFKVVTEAARLHGTE
jgi:hypothetical protein